MRKDQGTYKCLATNVAGSDLMETDLVVECAFLNFTVIEYYRIYFGII